jgi:hypothetical protein
MGGDTAQAPALGRPDLDRQRGFQGGEQPLERRPFSPRHLPIRPSEDGLSPLWLNPCHDLTLHSVDQGDKGRPRARSRSPAGYDADAGHLGLLTDSQMTPSPARYGSPMNGWLAH